jgi:hypothetical protein
MAIRVLLVVPVACASLAGAAYADDASTSQALAQGQANAREFGVFFGGTATQYDVCAKKGFLPKGKQSAEATAKSILEKMRQATPGPDQSAYVQEGWDLAKREIAKHSSDYTREKCTSWVGKEWAKMLATMHAQ